MCGLFGLVNNDLFQIDERKFLEQSLLVGTLRGSDGTGLVRVNYEGEFGLYKRALAGPDFLQLAATERLLSAKSRFSFGHHRAMTRGEVSDRNTHPFVKDGFILVHNGTLTNSYSMCSEAKVDSEAIVRYMAQHGELETLKKIEGAYALIWYNMEDKSLNLARNSERPLYWVAHKDKKAIFFASESSMMFWLLERNKIPVNNTAHQVKEEHHWKIFLDPKKKDVVTKYVGAKRPVTTGYSSYGYDTDDERWAGWNRYDRTTGYVNHGATLIKKGGRFSAQYTHTATIWIKQSNQEVHVFKHLLDKAPNYYIPKGRQIFTKDAWYQVEALEDRNFSSDYSNKEVKVLRRIKNKRSDEVAALEKTAAKMSALKAALPQYTLVDIIADRVVPASSAGIVNVVGHVANDDKTVAKVFSLPTGRAREGVKYKTKVLSHAMSEDYNPYVVVDKDYFLEVVPSTPAVFRNYKGPGGLKLNKSEIDEMVKDGCSICRAPIMDAELDYIGWDTLGLPVCTSCTNPLDGDLH